MVAGCLRIVNREVHELQEDSDFLFHHLTVLHAGPNCGVPLLQVFAALDSAKDGKGKVASRKDEKQLPRASNLKL